MSFNFTAADAATMTLPNGKPVQLSRFGFSTSTSSAPPSVNCTSPQILQNGSCVTATAPVPIRPVFYFTITPVQSGNYYGVMLCYAALTIATHWSIPFLSAMKSYKTRIPPKP
jgi:hypothetical protein